MLVSPTIFIPREVKCFYSVKERRQQPRRTAFSSRNIPEFSKMRPTVNSHNFGQFNRRWAIFSTPVGNIFPQLFGQPNSAKIGAIAA